MIDTGETAMRAADAKNPDQLFTVGGDVYEGARTATGSTSTRS
jgi:hypothetical protein